MQSSHLLVGYAIARLPAHQIRRSGFRHPRTKLPDEKGPAPAVGWCGIGVPLRSRERFWGSQGFIQPSTGLELP